MPLSRKNSVVAQFPLVPKLYLGTHLLRQFHCRSRRNERVQVTAKWNFARNRMRSQMKFGNEEENSPAVSLAFKSSFPLAPKLYLGTRLLRQFHCRSRRTERVQVTAKWNFARNRMRSQMKFGNEEERHFRAECDGHQRNPSPPQSC